MITCGSMYIERPIGSTTKNDFSEDNQDYSKVPRYLGPTELGSRNIATFVGSCLD